MPFSLPRRSFIKKTALATVTLGGSSAVYGQTVERHWLEVVTVPLPLGLESPLRIVVMGDIHYDPHREEKYLRGVLDQANALKPDLFLFTGDFVTASADCVPELSGILASARATHGCYAVMGNHDCLHRHKLIPALRDVGIVTLTNASVPLPGQSNWFLTGIMSLLMGPQNTSAITESPADSRHILLAHEPDAFDDVTDSRIALQISGHTHGGQIRAPFIGAIVLPKWGKNYEMGLYQKNGRRLYVNRGTGTIGPNVRLNCRPELTLLELS